MKRIIFCVLTLLILSMRLIASPGDTLVYGAFGKVSIYRPPAQPVAVILFVSGDGGWNSGVIDMARNMVAQGALVAGIDIVHYFKYSKSKKVKCYYPAGDFEQLSLLLQKKYKIKQYLKPILVGYSSGATFVYGILAQAPANTFKGAIALGFCPDIDMDKTLCNGTGLNTHALKEGKSYYLEASGKLTAPFIVLQGMDDKVCPFVVTQRYMHEMRLGSLVSLPKVGHGFAKTPFWLPQFITAYKNVMKAPSYAEQKAAENTILQSQHLVPLPLDMPLTLIPATGGSPLPLTFMISGDGGWTSFDQSLAEALAEKGMPVIGMDAQKYFWNEKTPGETTADVSKAIQHYLQQWNVKSFVLAGYSFGASVVPFIASRLPETLKASMRGVYSLSPDEKADFEIHISDMLEIGSSEDTYNVQEELIKIKSMNPVCIFGADEDATTRNDFSQAGIRVITLPGSHHYNNDYPGIAESILGNLK